MKDLRRFPRVKLICRIQLEEHTDSRVKDISQTGINLITAKPLSKGSPLLVEIPLARKQTIKTAGLVLWSKLNQEDLWENGIKFFSIDSQGRLQLKNYIDGNKYQKSERRAKTRHNLEIKIQYSMKTKCRTKDITHQGMRIVTKKPLPQGQIIQLQLNLPKSKIYTKGRVIWTSPRKPRTFEQGIEFWEIDDITIKALAEYFDKKATGIPSIEEIRLES